jgi:hypothetical protein
MDRVMDFFAIHGFKIYMAGVVAVMVVLAFIVGTVTAEPIRTDKVYVPAPTVTTTTDVTLHPIVRPPKVITKFKTVTQTGFVTVTVTETVREKKQEDFTPPWLK